jgi:hypothetical protein
MIDHFLDDRVTNRRVAVMLYAGTQLPAVKPAPPPVDDDTTPFRRSYLAAVQAEEARKLAMEQSGLPEHRPYRRRRMVNIDGIRIETTCHPDELPAAQHGRNGAADRRCGLEGRKSDSRAGSR